MNRITSVAALAVLLTARVAHAQDQDLEQLLGTSVVTTASRTAETTDVAPATSVNITSDDLRRFGIHTLEEAINFLSLGMSSGGRNFHGREPEIGSRGVLITGDEGNHILLLVNGHAVNEPGRGAADFGEGAGIPLEMVDHIEVILGPGSVLYGSNAMLGVVNVITKSASDYSGVHVLAEAGDPSSLRAVAGAGYQTQLFGQKLDVTATLEYLERRGPKLYLPTQRLDRDIYTGEKPQVGPDAEDGDGVWGGAVADANYARIPSGLLRVRLGDAVLNVHARTSKVGSYLNQFSFDDPNNYVTKQALSADLMYTKLLTPTVEVSVRAYADGFGWREHQDAYNPIGCQNLPPCSVVIVRTTRWAGLEPRASFDWFKNQRLVTTIGVEGRVRDVRTKKENYDLDSSTLHFSSQNVLSVRDTDLGAYLQQTLQATSWLAFNAGARVDRDERFDPVVSPRLAAVTSLWEGSKLRGIYSEAFRAPGRIETDVRFAGNIVPDLKPETVRSVEASLEQQLGTHRLLFGAFRTNWSGMVTRVVLSDEERAEVLGPLEAVLNRNIVFSQIRNAAEIENYGVNVGYRGTFLQERLSLGAGFTWGHARRQGVAGSTELEVAPELIGNARVAYALGGRAPTFGLAMAYLDQRLANKAIEGKFAPTPYAPAQLDLRLTISGDVPGVSGLSYRLVGNHLTATRGAYVAGPTEEAQVAHPAAVLDPLKQYEVFWGLQYDFAR